MTTTPSQPSDPLTVASLPQLAGVFRLSQSTLKRFLADGMPRKGSNGYDVADCFEWYRTNKAVAGIDDRKKLAEAVDRERSAELRELQIQREREEWIEKGEAGRKVGRAFARVRRNLLSLPEILAPFFPETIRDDCVATVNHKVRILLHELASVKATDFPDET